MKKKIKSTKVAKELVVKTPTQEVRKTEPFAWTDEQVELIKNTVAKNATDDELKLFLYTAKRTGLDPLTKQIHFVKRGFGDKAQMTVQTGIDGYRAIAERTGQLAGIDDAVFEGDSPTDQHPTKATVNVYRMVKGLRVAFVASARWEEYAPQGNQAFMWKKMPYLMLGKCAEALALRKAFPNDLTGLYTNEEMAQADTSPKTIQTTHHEVISPVKAEIRIESQSRIQPTDPKTALIRLKNSIHKSLLILNPEVNTQNVHEIVLKHTGLNLVEENYKEIDARLLIKLTESPKEEDYNENI